MNSSIFEFNVLCRIQETVNLKAIPRREGEDDIEENKENDASRAPPGDRTKFNRKDSNTPLNIPKGTCSIYGN